MRIGSDTFQEMVDTENRLLRTFTYSSPQTCMYPLILGQGIYRALLYEFRVARTPSVYLSLKLHKPSWMYLDQGPVAPT